MSTPSYSLLLKEHQNYFGVDENLGPVAVSIRREKLEEGKEGPQYNYRVIFRTSEVGRHLLNTVLPHHLTDLCRSIGL
jgi:hypothetical protein